MSVVPEIKSIDIRGTYLSLWAPANARDFYFQMTLSIGPSGASSFDYFYCDVCSQAWLFRELEEKKAILFEKGLIVTEFDRAEIESVLRARVQRASSASWVGVVESLRAFLQWQYDGYQAWIAE